MGVATTLRLVRVSRRDQRAEGVSMRGTGAACAPERRPYRQHVRVMVVALLASMAAACQHDAGPMASARGPTGATVAFESIDGPPIGVFNKLVQNLNEEADVRQVPV